MHKKVELNLNMFHFYRNLEKKNTKMNINTVLLCKSLTSGITGIFFFYFLASREYLDNKILGAVQSCGAEVA